MKRSNSYVLVLNQDFDDLKTLESLLGSLSCPTVVAESVDQAVARVGQIHPCLIILSGNQHAWSKTLVNEIRRKTESSTTIVALTEHHNPSWLHHDENPGLDGFLVKPLNIDVLISLVQSAWAKQTCCVDV